MSIEIIRYNPICVMTRFVIAKVYCSIERLV